MRGAAAPLLHGLLQVRPATGAAGRPPQRQAKPPAASQRTRSWGRYRTPLAAGVAPLQLAMAAPCAKGCPVIPGGRAAPATAPRRVVGTSAYTQYADAPPPCDAPHPAPRADPPRITGQPLAAEDRLVKDRLALGAPHAVGAHRVHRVRAAHRALMPLGHPPSPAYTRARDPASRISSKSTS